MDSRAVSGRIKANIWPWLRERGFSRFSERSAWRYVAEAIHVVTFQSFNAYNAEVLGVTTYSFSVRLGIHLTQIPPACGGTAIPRKGPPKPHEYECHLRASMRRSLSQPQACRSDIWYIDPSGKYLDPAMEDVASQLGAVDTGWFKRYSVQGEVLSLLLGPSLDDPEGAVWGFGNPDSPLRHYQIGYMARALGHQELAREHLTRAAVHFRGNERLAADIVDCGWEH